jgi:hypothetical protein
MSAINSSWAAQGLNSDGYDDGTLVWSTILNKQSTFKEAEEVCQTKTKNSLTGGKWVLPTPEQMKIFYQHVAVDKSNLPNWSLGMTWLSTKVGDKKHDAANLGDGNFNWKGQEDSKRLNVTCVTPNLAHFIYDGHVSWSRTTSERKTVENAQKYCAGLEKDIDQVHPWRLPLLKELTSFELNVVRKRRKDLLDAGWTLDTTLTSEPHGRPMYAAVNLKTGAFVTTTQAYVTCIR